MLVELGRVVRVVDAVVGGVLRFLRRPEGATSGRPGRRRSAARWWAGEHGIAVAPRRDRGPSRRAPPRRRRDRGRHLCRPGWLRRGAARSSGRRPRCRGRWRCLRFGGLGRLRRGRWRCLRFGGLGRLRRGRWRCLRFGGLGDLRRGRWRCLRFRIIGRVEVEREQFVQQPWAGGHRGLVGRSRRGRRGGLGRGRFELDLLLVGGLRDGVGGLGFVGLGTCHFGCRGHRPAGELIQDVIHPRRVGGVRLARGIPGRFLGHRGFTVTDPTLCPAVIRCSARGFVAPPRRRVRAGVPGSL